MGMFDYFRVKKEIPIPEELKPLNIDWKNLEFQTKDLENCLLEYFIGEDSFLYEVEVDREYIPFTEEEKKNQDYRAWSPWKDVVEKSRTNKKVNFHGKIKFYTYETFSEDEDFFIDYDAYFIYGKLDKIELLKFEKIPSRKKNYENFIKELEEKENRLLKKIKKTIRPLGWGFFWRKVANLTKYFSKKFDSAFYFIHSKLL
jgi:hypothetical protein